MEIYQNKHENQNKKQMKQLHNIEIKLFENLSK